MIYCRIVNEYLSPAKSIWINIPQRIIEGVSISVPALRFALLSSCIGRVNAGKSALRAAVVPCPKIIQPCLNIALFRCELLAHIIHLTIALCRRPAADARANFLAEW